MQSNFSSLQKPNQMSERKCREVFLTDNNWSLAQRVQTFCLSSIWCENANFVLLKQAEITRKRIKLYQLFFMHFHAFSCIILRHVLETYSNR